MSTTLRSAVLFAMSAVCAQAQPESKSSEKVEKKNITVITGESSADGSSEVRREMEKDCILSLPNPDQLEPQVTSEAVYLRGINGEPGHDAWAKVYTARLDIDYLNYQKELLIVTTRSVQGQEPVIKEVEKKLKHTESFVSNPAEGDTFAGRSNRQYYFTEAKDAIKDVKKRAKIWIEQQTAVVCTEK